MFALKNESVREIIIHSGNERKIRYLNLVFMFLSSYIFFYLKRTLFLPYIFSAFRNSMTVSFYLYFFLFCKYFHHTQNILKKMR